MCQTITHQNPPKKANRVNQNFTFQFILKFLNKYKIFTFPFNKSLQRIAMISIKAQTFPRVLNFNSVHVTPRYLHKVAD